MRSRPAGWPDAELVLAAQRGDVESIRVLLGVSHPHVHRFARTVCVTEQDAEDATQEALIVLYRKIGTLRASAALASWMFRIVSNECVRRAAQARRRRQEPLESMTDTPRAGATEDEVMQRLETERLAAAIAALPEDQRRVLILRDVYGYGGKQVADSLGLSIAAMKSRLHRARTALRSDLHEP